MSERVPRYTSYPTAPHFHGGINNQVVKTWLSELNTQHDLSLYFHIPFCQQLCWFCGCFTKVINTYEPVEYYLELLSKEIDYIGKTVGNTRVKHIHFGGGSPTIVKGADFLKLIQQVGQLFDIAPDAEIDIEIDPRSVDEEKINAYATSGVKRVSLGVQDFDEGVQKAINRVQSYELVRDVVQMVRKAGIEAVNLDLIYGLPYQSEETILRTIDLTLSLNPDRVSLFGYAHVPWMKKHQQLVPEEALPASQERLKLFHLATEALLAAGYVAIGLDHFAKPDDLMAVQQKEGKLNRNFQGYTTDKAEALIGMGVSSISSLPQGYCQNISDVGEYAKALKAGQLPIKRGIAIDQEDIDRREIIMSLMCHLTAEVDENRYGEELFALKPWFDKGDVRFENGILSVNPAVQSHIRLIASAFDAYLHADNARYSQAV